MATSLIPVGITKIQQAMKYKYRISKARDGGNKQ